MDLNSLPWSELLIIDDQEYFERQLRLLQFIQAERSQYTISLPDNQTLYVSPEVVFDLIEDESCLIEEGKIRDLSNSCYPVADLVALFFTVQSGIELRVTLTDRFEMVREFLPEVADAALTNFVKQASYKPIYRWNEELVSNVWSSYGAGIKIQEVSTVFYYHPYTCWKTDSTISPKDLPEVPELLNDSIETTRIIWNLGMESTLQSLQDRRQDQNCIDGKVIANARARLSPTQLAEYERHIRETKSDLEDVITRAIVKFLVSGK